MRLTVPPLALASALAAALTACGDDRPPRAFDAAAENACYKWWDVQRETRDGVLTPAEIRPRMRAVYESGSASSSSAVREATAAAMRAVTSGSQPEMAAAFAALRVTCDRVAADVKAQRG